MWLCFGTGNSLLKSLGHSGADHWCQEQPLWHEGAFLYIFLLFMSSCRLICAILISRDKSMMYPTLTRLAVTYSHAGFAVSMILKHFDWDVVMLMCEELPLDAGQGHSDLFFLRSALMQYLHRPLEHIINPKVQSPKYFLNVLRNMQARSKFVSSVPISFIHAAFCVFILSNFSLFHL